MGWVCFLGIRWTWKVFGNLGILVNLFWDRGHQVSAGFQGGINLAHLVSHWFTLAFGVFNLSYHGDRFL